MSPDARRSRHDVHSEPKTRESTGGSAHTPRRRFLAAVGAMVAGGLAGVCPIVANAAALLKPLRRRERDAELVRVAIFDSLSESRPRRFTVSSDRVDAWTTHRATPVGAVYLTRSGDEVTALNAACPHAGCLVNPAEDGSRPECPCHRSVSDLDGVRLGGPAPRNMDELAAEVRDDAAVWVGFRDFRPGTAERIPV